MINNVSTQNLYIKTKGEIYNLKIKIVFFVIDSGTEMTVYVKFEI